MHIKKDDHKQTSFLAIFFLPTKFFIYFPIALFHDLYFIRSQGLYCVY